MTTQNEPGQKAPAEKDNQQSPEEISKGAHQNDQLTALRQNQAETGGQEDPQKKAGTPPIGDEELDRAD